MLVEDNPNFEKAVFNVITNGQISPITAFKEAVSVMYSQMSVFNKVLIYQKYQLMIQVMIMLSLKI